MSSIHQSALLEQAHNAAQRISLPWMCSVFRELYYQLWKGHWRVEHVEDDNNQKLSGSHCRLHLTVEMIQQAQTLCLRVADRWSQRMQGMGHVEVSLWIQSLVPREMDTFFEIGDPPFPPEDLPRPDQHEKKKEPAIDPSLRKKETPTLCASATLRQLELTNCRDANLTHALQEQFVIDQLDEMGYSAKTYWPFDWEVIQEGNRKLPQRLYSGNGTSLKLKLVLKSSVPPKESTAAATANDHDNTPRKQEECKVSFPPKDQSSQWTEQMVVSYKRRGAFSRRFQETSSIINSAQKRRKIASPPKETSRPPSDTQQDKIPWNPQIANEIAYPNNLDAYLHTSDEATTNTLLGSLKPLGHIHHVLQLPTDHLPEKQTTGRKQRRRLTRSVQERIGQHRMEKDVKPHKVRSKIKCTLKEDLEESSEMDHWWDLDLGECLLDLEDENEDGVVATRKLYAFSSLEVSLKDEDTTTDKRNNKKGELLRQDKETIVQNFGGREIGEHNPCLEDSFRDR